jgi:hypothetical protein
MSETQRWLSNSQMRGALHVVEELLETNGYIAVLKLSGLERYTEQFPPDDEQMDIPRGDVVALFSGIVSMFGDQGARGVLRRWGRAFAERRLRRRLALRVLRAGLRLLPPDQSMRAVLERLLHHVDLANADQPPALDDRGDHFILQIEDCPYCIGPGLMPQGCPAALGLLEGTLRWMTGNDYDVSEDVSGAPGAAVFRIRKRPIGRR